MRHEKGHERAAKAPLVERVLQRVNLDKVGKHNIYCLALQNKRRQSLISFIVQQVVKNEKVLHSLHERQRLDQFVVF